MCNAAIRSDFAAGLLVALTRWGSLPLVCVRKGLLSDYKYSDVRIDTTPYVATKDVLQ